MKTLAKHEFDIGADAKAGLELGIDQSNLVVEVKAAYPLVKIVEPATKALDSLLVKLEQAIPGSWDAPIIEKVKQEYKDELVKLLAE